ncbi:MAG: metallophosphoesterase family protein [Propionibacteriaceae bacterium]|jgi:hypothetical protein|nr:metallophosphoesterase family protein [Propionibacteriaceae bacterium]
MTAPNRLAALVGIVAVALAATFATAAPTAQADTAGISTVTRVAVADASTSAGFAWHTDRTSSSSDPQPVTGLAWGPTGSFNCAQSTLASATAPTTTVYDRITYSQVTLTGLQPGTYYSYCVILSTGVRTPVTTFKTAAQSSTTMLAFADVNWRSTVDNHVPETLAAAQAAYPKADFAVLTGTLASSSDTTHAFGFLNAIATASQRLTWAPTAHTSGSSNRYYQYGFALPTTGTYDLANYAVRRGPVLLLVVNTRLTATANIDATVSWINQQVNALGSAKATTWVVAAIPTEFYGNTSTTSTLRTRVHEAFRANGVALVLQGGTKAYTRSFPVAATPYFDYPSPERVATKDGVVYVTPGASGIEQATVSSSATTATTAWLQAWTPEMTSSERSAAAKKSYSAITATAAYLTLTARQADGTVLDEFTIDRQATPTADPQRLQPFGLNNGFGADPQTERVITWVMKTSDKWSDVSITWGTDGRERKSEVVRTVLKSDLSAYTAYTFNARGLQPGATYTYYITGKKANARGLTQTYESPHYSFTTEAADAGAFSFIDFADSQGSSSTYDEYWGNTLRTALARNPEAAFATHTGDIIDSTSTSHYEGWLGAIGTSLSSVAFNPVLGNHDYGAERGAGLYAKVFERASAHSAQCPVPSGFPLTYAHAYSNALLVYLNTNPSDSSGTGSSVKLAEEVQLANWVQCVVTADRQTHPDRWVIVLMHKSPFGGKHAGTTLTDQGDLGGAAYLRQAFGPVFTSLGVDLVLAGHDHNLIRSYPIRYTSSVAYGHSGDTVSSSADGLVYFIPRNSGEKTYSPTSYSATVRPWINKLWNISTSTPELTVYAVVTVSDQSIRVVAYSVDGVVRDSFTVVR